VEQGQAPCCRAFDAAIRVAQSQLKDRGVHMGSLFIGEQVGEGDLRGMD